MTAMKRIAVALRGDTPAELLPPDLITEAEIREHVSQEPMKEGGV